MQSLFSVFICTLTYDVIHSQVFEKKKKEKKKNVCVSLRLFNSSGESHSSGGLGESKFKKRSIFGEFFRS